MYKIREHFNLEEILNNFFLYDKDNSWALFIQENKIIIKGIICKLNFKYS